MDAGRLTEKDRLRPAAIGDQICSRSPALRIVRFIDHRAVSFDGACTLPQLDCETQAKKWEFIEITA